MVYRIPPHRHSPWSVFRRTFLILLLVYELWFFTAFYLINYCFPPEADSWWVPGWWLFFAIFLLALVVAFNVTYQFIRSLRQLNWFAPREAFLTMVEEGLIVESPSRGTSVYFPWNGLRLRAAAGGMLQLQTPIGNMVVGINGMSAARQKEVVATLRRFLGTRKKPIHGVFDPSQAAAPFAPKLAAAVPPDLPPLPQRHISPPALEGVRATLTRSRTRLQQRELWALAMRPGALFVLFSCLMVAAMAFEAGALAVSEDWEEAFFIAILLYCCFWFIRRIGCPGNRRMLQVPSPSRLLLTQAEALECHENGAWSCAPLLPAAEGRLLRMRHSWYVMKDGLLPMWEVDAEGDTPPPVLERYPRMAAPRNGWRGLLVTAVALLAFIGGCWFASRPTEAELAFPALLEQRENPDALRQYAARYYAAGQVLDTPHLSELYKDDDDEAHSGYALIFTDSAPQPDDDDGRFHLAWQVWVELGLDGECISISSYPAYWCPCNDWLDGPPDWLMEKDED